jgi:UDPglucose 6-dehydrogenase
MIETKYNIHISLNIEIKEIIQMYNICVMGTGYVGLVSGTCFADIGHHVICCDIDEEKINQLNQGEIPIYEPGLAELVQKNMQTGRLFFTTDIPQAILASDIIYIAVGTPMSADGQANLTYVEEVAKTIGLHLRGYKIIVNKSTVPVGTGKLVQSIVQQHQVDASIEFDVVSNPEFLREGTAIADFMQMERVVIGAERTEPASIIAELHAPLNTVTFITDLESAEMIKYAANGFLATKISFINAIANICERVGADVEQVAKGMGLDSRIGQRHLQAGIGYGGSCFPKDTHALLHIANEHGYSFDLMKSVITTNHQQRLVVVDKLQQIFGDLTGKRIAILGLAFKSNTDDMREAPALEIVPALHRLGAELRAYDPIAISHAQAIFRDQTTYHTDIYEAVQDADTCLILTDWPAIREINLVQLKTKLRTPIIVDGRNCMPREQMKQYGFIYHSIGQLPIVPSVIS